MIEELEKVALPYALSVPDPARGRARARVRLRDADAGREPGRGARPAVRRALRDRRPPRVSVGREFPARAGASGDAHERVGAAASRAGCSCETSRAGPASRDASASRSGRPAENDALLAALDGGARMSSSRRAARRRSCSARPRRRRSRSTLVLDGSGTTKVATGIPFFDHMLEQLGKHAGFDLTIAAEGDLEIDLHHTVEDVGIVLGNARARSARRQDRCPPLRQRARAPRRSARAGRVGPLGPSVPRLRGRPGRRVDRHLRPAARRGVLEGLRRRRACHAAHPQRLGHATATT